MEACEFCVEARGAYLATAAIPESNCLSSRSRLAPESYPAGDDYSLCCVFAYSDESFLESF